MNAWQVINDSPYLSAIVIVVVALSCLEVAMKGWGRFVRMMILRKHGWPPAHLDADGDFKRELERKDGAP